MRPISQDEAEQMRNALKEIAGFYNPARVRNSGQAAALAARKTLEELGLFFQKDALETSGQRADDPNRS